MSDVKNFDPAGLVQEDELKELTEAQDTTGGATPTVTIPLTIAVSVAFCPSTKCSSAC